MHAFKTKKLSYSPFSIYEYRVTPRPMNSTETILHLTDYALLKPSQYNLRTLEESSANLYKLLLT